jgi:hypothetical protein
MSKLSIIFSKESPTWVRVMAVIGMLIWVAHLGLSVVTSLYFHQLRKANCACATDIRGTVLFWLSLGFAAVAPVMLFLTHRFRESSSNQTNNVLRALALGELGLVITIVVLGSLYLRDLENERCQCAKQDPRWKALRVWMYLWYAQLGLIGVLFVFTIILFGVLHIRQS